MSMKPTHPDYENERQGRTADTIVGIIVALGPDYAPANAVELSRMVSKTSRFVQAMAPHPTKMVNDYHWWFKVECMALVQLASRFVHD